MFFDKKRAASVILSKMDKDGRSKEMHVAPESGEHNEYTSFAEDLLSAVKENSVQRVASVLKNYHEMIKEEDEEEDKQEG